MSQVAVGAQSRDEKIRELSRELAKLKGQREPDPVKKEERDTAEHRKHAVKKSREGRVHLAPGYIATTYPGSLYSTMLHVLARLGRLAMHPQMFDAFSSDRSPAAARKLLNRVGVSRADLDAAVRADDLFREHCSKRTSRLKEQAAAGDRRAQAILNDRAICDARGNWRGDIDEAVQILYGRRSPHLSGRRKNTDIIRRLKLVFDIGQRGNEQVCYLYPQKYFSLFQQARSLSAE